ncbi:MAG TPA: hypothetical protein VEZ12_10670 [Herpetosiphonaceae bacterium]|nr:hypothetical protein [Herpetosiphonaceae bacterium]
MANVRLGLFLGVVGCIGLGWWRDVPSLFAAAVILAAGFLVVVVRHRRLANLRHRYDELWTINNEGLQRLRRDWNVLPLRRPASVPPEHPFAADLDLLGHASLQHLLNTAHTPVGQVTLQDWLLNPAPPEVVRARQGVVAELAHRIDFRDELALRGREMGSLQSDYEAFLRWAEAPPWLVQRRWLLWAARLLPLLALGSGVLWVTGWLSAPLWVLFIFANIIITLFAGSAVDAVIDQVATRQGAFRAYGRLFGLLLGTRFEAAGLKAAQTALGEGPDAADWQMHRLQRIMIAADLRLWLLFAILQWTTLWTVHVLWLLERWQRASGVRARAWLDALGEVEALAALATLDHDHPTWTFPEIAAAAPPFLIGWGLAHPLLKPGVVVANEVEVGPPGTFVLVTGSNMSGKSTLLRAIGVNIVLAQAGGPVNAFLLRMPPTTLATSMRVQDSLEQGVSYFLAELRRLKSVVDAAHHARVVGTCTLIFLLDEILHGTNTAERQIAARSILRHLLDLEAMGAVSTHDLQLVDTPELLRACRPVHFREIFHRGPDGPSMSFDYILRPGIAPTTNALKLMEIVGLPAIAPAIEPVASSTKGPSH